MFAIGTGKSVEPDEKVRLMQEDARFELDQGDAASLGVIRAVKNAQRSKPLPPSAPKVFLSNDCAFNCSYCDCRSGNECKRRYESTPRELAALALRQANATGQGIFITSAVIKNPDHTQELIVETLRILRREHHYGGYLHAKVMPGADALLIEQSGRLANRLSVNIEVAQSDGYQQIARNKSKKTILTPMGQISDMIQRARAERTPLAPAFATSQTTQLMAGSTGEDDRAILTLSNGLYSKYHLSRVYYTAFQYRRPARGYEALPLVSTPHWRMARLYQADRLMQLYGFTPDELAPENAPNLESNVDPKLSWALRNLDQFPVEVNRAPLEMLLRVPGIGMTYAARIVEARRQFVLTHAALEGLGISLKRALPFITCGGKYLGGRWTDEGQLRARFAEPIQEMMDFSDLC